VAARALRSHDRQRVKPVDRVGVAADHATGVVGQVRGRDARVRGRDVRVAAEHVRLAIRVRLARREHDVSRPGDRVIERVVVRRVGRLGELDVEDDRSRPVRAQPVDDLAVPASRERPRMVEVVERRVVDAHHDHVVGSHRRPQREPDIDRTVLEAPQDPAPEHRQADHQRDRRD
jgi:hypothetical protein